MTHTIPIAAIQPTIVPLPSWGLIRVSGADARTFLHGQFSNDLLALPPDGAQWTAYCSAKGRMLAGFFAWIDPGDAVWLACDHGLVEGLIKRLRMFVLRAKVQLDDMSSSWHVEGVLGAGGPDAMQVVRDGDTHRIGLPGIHGVGRFLQFRAGPPQPVASEAAWALGMIRAGEAWILPSTREQFVPQMVNFDAIGGINFRKGCYPGQEVVARAHYRGAVKRRMRLGRVDATAEAGMPLFTSGANAQECGTVANAVATENRSELLAVVPLDAGPGTVHLGAPDGPVLTFADLPYAIPEAA